VQVLSSRAHEISTKDKKQTILPDHVIRAIRGMGFEEWVPALEEALQEHKDGSKSAQAHVLARAASALAAQTNAL
jgi:down-regulator of transcription 1